MSRERGEGRGVARKDFMMLWLLCNLQDTALATGRAFNGAQ